MRKATKTQKPTEVTNLTSFKKRRQKGVAVAQRPLCTILSICTNIRTSEKKTKEEKQITPTPPTK